MSEYVQLSRRIKLPATGDPAAIQTIPFEHGSPYEKLNIWMTVAGAGTVNVSAQPKFAGANDGAATAFNTNNSTKKIFMQTVGEIRPGSRPPPKSASDTASAIPPKTELLITNAGAGEVNIDLFMCANTPGGM